MPARPKPASAGTYVYCIGSSEAFGDDSRPLQSAAVGGRSDLIRTIRFRNLVAIVSESPSARVDVTRENTLAHERVLEEALTRSEILPVRFGTVAKCDEDVLQKLLKRRFGELVYLLNGIQGRVELGLKVLWNRERLFADIADENEQIRPLRDSIAGRTPEESYYERIQLGRLIEDAITQRRDREADEILEVLGPLAVERKANKILTDMMVLNAAFLVEKTQESAFDARVSALGEARAATHTFKYVGSVPPYNFVNVVVHWDSD